MNTSHPLHARPRGTMQALLGPLARYTRFVLLGKRALWVMALLLAVTLIAVAWLNSGEGGARIVLASRDKDEGQAAALMSKPRYQGLDAKNQPFNILAERAVQRDMNTVELQQVSADLSTNDGRWLALTATGALYRTEAKLLDLSGGVSLFYDEGYEFRTDRVRLDVGAGTAEGEVPVEGQGPAGTLKADRFKVLDRGAILQFNGNVKVTLYEEN